jgi:hypothetical protein
MVYMSRFLENLKKNADLEIYYLLLDLDLEGRVKNLKNLFFLIFRLHWSVEADRKAVMILDWLIEANKDLRFSEKEFTGYELMSLKAEVAMDVYPIIPNNDLKAFLQVRESALSHILEWCYVTPDEEESDSIFKFFLSQASPRCDEELALTKRNLKLNADKAASKERLLRHILSLNLEDENKVPGHLLESGRMLLNSWIRKVDMCEASRILRATSPLEGCPDRAFIYLKECASVIARAEKECGPVHYVVDCGWRSPEK